MVQDGRPAEPAFPGVGTNGQGVSFSLVEASFSPVLGEVQAVQNFSTVTATCMDKTRQNWGCWLSCVIRVPLQVCFFSEAPANKRMGVGIVFALSLCEQHIL